MASALERCASVPGAASGVCPHQQLGYAQRRAQRSVLASTSDAHFWTVWGRSGLRQADMQTC
eukprot:146355-Rhodomonas_salina.1